jgi:hypothetical protein
MPEIVNKTPFATHYVLLPNEQGVDTLYVNVKASFDIGHNWTLSDPQVKPLLEDAYWGEPGASSIKISTDAHLGKPTTDIAVLGNACAPGAPPLQVLDVSVRVGQCKAALRVFGDRTWDKGQITPPSHFSTLPIRYEHAFGGQHWEDGELVGLEPRNPVGKGYCGTRKVADMDGRPLPNIENPHQLIRHPSDTPQPAGFGFIAPNWQQRAQYAGTYDEHWQQYRVPYPPQDYQPRFQNAAHPDLISATYLTGGEPVELVNMHPAGPLQFSLPRVSLGGRVHVGTESPRRLQFNMETVVIDVAAMQLCLVWKAACLVNNAFPRLRAITVNMSNA